MAKYFFIVESGKEADTDNVIGVSSISNRLVVSKCNGTDLQLWKWNDHGCIENKDSGHVITRFRLFLRPHALCVKKDEDKSFQKWRIEQGMIASANDYYISVRRGSEGVRFAYLTAIKGNSKDNCKDIDNYNRKWLLIPQATWNAYMLYYVKQNPLMKTVLLRENLLHHTGCILGCTIEEYADTLDRYADKCKKCAGTLDDVTKDVGKAKVAAGSAAIVGGTLGLLGIGLAPVTAGASLGLAVASVSTTGASALTSIGGLITTVVYRTREKNKMKRDVEKATRVTTGLASMILDIYENSKEGEKFQKTSEGANYLEWLRFALTGVAIFNSAMNGVDVASALIELQAAASIIKVDAKVLSRLTVTLAERASANGLKVPGKVFIKAGTRGAKIFGSIANIVIIAVGIYDIYDGARDMRTESAIGKSQRALMEEITDVGKQLIQQYNEILSNNEPQ